MEHELRQTPCVVKTGDVSNGVKETSHHLYFLCITLAVLCRKIIDKTEESGAPSRRECSENDGGYCQRGMEDHEELGEMGMLLYELLTRKLA